MENERSDVSGFSSIEVTALLAVLILIGSMIWQAHEKIQAQDARLSYVMAPKASATDGSQQNTNLSALFASVMQPPTSTSSSTSRVGEAVMDQLLGTYATLKQQGVYTPTSATALGNMMAPMIHVELAYQKITAQDISSSLDVSETAGLAYQKALNDALAPLRKNTAPEFEFLGRYLETKNPQYLTEMRDVAMLYLDAASNTARLIVPRDVVTYHVAIINSLEEFSAVLNAFANYADAPIESVALLRSYNIAEHDVLNAFSALRYYYANKISH